MFRYSFICHITCLLHSPSAYTIAHHARQSGAKGKNGMDNGRVGQLLICRSSCVILRKALRCSGLRERYQSSHLHSSEETHLSSFIPSPQ